MGRPHSCKIHQQIRTESKKGNGNKEKHGNRVRQPEERSRLKMGGEKMSRGRTAILVVLSVLVFITLGLQFIVSLFTLSYGHLFLVEVFVLTSLFLAFEVGLLTVLVASINSSVQDMQKEHQKE